jgi:hypothetical protein
MLFICIKRMEAKMHIEELQESRHVHMHLHSMQIIKSRTHETGRNQVVCTL